MYALNEVTGTSVSSLSCKNDEKAAGVLYAAVDAFNAEGLSGDANETAKLLQKLYPQSKQAKNVKVQE